tara:strand:- start:2627 stop:3085 length:459 start_codon:yes stop_codon:yes gene_type:complete
MAVRDTYTPLLSEVLKKVHNAKTKDKKVSILQQYDCEPLRMVIKSSFDPNIKWVMPEGNVPYNPNEAEAGTEHTVLRKEARKLYRFIEGGDATIPQFKKEDMFIQMLEGLHSSEAELIINAKDKKLHQVYKGLSAAVVKEAFDWNDNYTRSA